MRTFSALILKFEYLDNRSKSYTVVFIALFESCVSSVSLLSRGMILNASALLYGLYRGPIESGARVRFGFMIVCILLLMVFFISSVVAVNYSRMVFYNTTGEIVTGESTLTEVTVAYAAAEKISWSHKYCRKDIGKKGLSYL